MRNNHFPGHIRVLDTEEAARMLHRQLLTTLRPRKGRRNGRRIKAPLRTLSPEELRKAARVAAESNPPATPEGDHEQVAASIRRKYALGINNTNVPQQALLHQDVHRASTFAQKTNVYPLTVQRRKESPSGRRARTG
ncbi:uncharacterized protein BDW70DRAFT_83076 [Aspergillus foveolatus]|uniref:uncharacterized protein n=1 Tax=Aspergillus foveolatus TaxID=210207 RepID=UPI003CCD0C33